jgi:SAM-dependent methyltransferase
MGPNCPICKSGPSEPKLRKKDIEIFECRECRVRFWVPDAGFSARNLYDGTYFSHAPGSSGYDDYGALEAPLRRNFARRLSVLPQPRDGDRLLDIGAAFGYAVDEAHRLGWRAFGVEVTLPVARRAAETTDTGIVVADAPALPFRSGDFAAVTLWDVLEHLREPHTVMEEVARILRPGGRLLLTTGDVQSLVARISGPRWHLYTLPEHLFFYSRESLRHLLGSHGLRIESIRLHASLYPLGYLVERLTKTLLGIEWGGGYESPLTRLAIPVNLFDIVTVAAVRENRSLD